MITAPNEPSNPLNGWKEIAAYIGKGVRQAQRWEKLGMPVHRVQGMDGVVYAYGDAIDAWRAGTQSQELDADPLDPVESIAAEETNPSAPGVPIPTTGPVRDGRARLLRNLVLSGLAGAVIAMTGGWLWQQSSDVRIERVIIDADRLVVIESGERVAWRYPLEFDSSLIDLGHARERPYVSIDTDGDGELELVVVVRRGSDRELLASDRVYCFSRRGKLRWSYALPEIPHTFEGARFSGPTRILAFTAADDGIVWAAMNHHTWWPTVVVRIDARGVGEERYVQSGGVYSLRFWSTRGRRFLVAGGLDNEYGLASIALLDADGAPATSPQHRGSGYACDSCPPAMPEAFLLLPRSDVSRVSDTDPYSIVVALERISDNLRVGSWEGAGGILYHVLNPDLSLRSERPSDSYGQAHARFEREGRLNHSFEKCPDRQTPSNSFVWRPNVGWSSEPPRHGIPSR